MVLNILEESWVDILGELEAVIEKTRFVQWPERELYTGSWQVYGLYDIQGNAIPEHTTECPKTAAAVKKIPGMKTAGFSMLAAGCVIKPHVGYTDSVLRAHLGLIIPEGDCALRVGETVHRWQPGKAFVFDDRVEHEAWNRTDSPRYVLLVDFLK